MVKVGFFYVEILCCSNFLRLLHCQNPGTEIGWVVGQIVTPQKVIVYLSFTYDNEFLRVTHCSVTLSALRVTLC